MKLISSRSDRIIKRVFPAMWFVLLAVFVISDLVGRELGAESLLLHLIMPVLAGVLIYLYIKGAVLNAADEVYDDGDALVVRVGGVEERISLSNIAQIKASVMGSTGTIYATARVTLILRHTCRFGKAIRFHSRPHIGLWNTSPDIDDLLRRIKFVDNR